MGFRYNEQQAKALLESLLMSAVYMEREYRRVAMDFDRFSTDPNAEGVMQGALQKIAKELGELADGEKAEADELRQALRSLGFSRQGSPGTAPSTSSQIKGTPVQGPSASP